MKKIIAVLAASGLLATSIPQQPLQPLKRLL